MLFCPVVFNFKNKSKKEIQFILESYVNKGRINEWTPLSHIKLKGKNKSVSIQVGRGMYCSPRSNKGPYTKVELGFPSFLFSKDFINTYAEDKSKPTGTVYGYVPIGILAQEIYKLHH